MNICILTKSTLSHHMGGIEVHVQTLAETTAQLGHRISVITTSHHSGIEHQEQNGIDYYFLKCTESSRYGKSWWLASSEKLSQLHKKEKIDIIWAESFSGWYYARKTKSTMGVPIISVMHGKGIFGVIQTGWNAVVSLRDFPNFFIKYLPESIFLITRLFWQTLHHSDGIIAISEATARAVSSEFFISSDKISVIYNGISTEFFKPDRDEGAFIRKRYSLSPEEKLLLMSGVIHKQKGMHIGMRAFAEIKKHIPSLKLMIVGDGPHLDYLKNLAKEINIDNEVFFVGFVPNEEIPSYYNAADLFLNPTIRVEGMPLVILEAMACGLPAIVSKIGGTQSTIDDGISGFFVQPKNIRQIVKKTTFLLGNQLLLEQMGRAAREKAINKFNREKMAIGYLNLSKKIIRIKET